MKGIEHNLKLQKFRFLIGRTYRVVYLKQVLNLGNKIGVVVRYSIVVLHRKILCRNYVTFLEQNTQSDDYSFLLPMTWRLGQRSKGRLPRSMPRV